MIKLFYWSPHIATAMEFKIFLIWRDIVTSHFPHASPYLGVWRLFSVQGPVFGWFAAHSSFGFDCWLFKLVLPDPERRSSTLCIGSSRHLPKGAPVWDSSYLVLRFWTADTRFGAKVIWSKCPLTTKIVVSGKDWLTVADHCTIEQSICLPKVVFPRPSIKCDCVQSFICAVRHWKGSFDLLGAEVWWSIRLWSSLILSKRWTSKLTGSKPFARWPFKYTSICSPKSTAKKASRLYEHKPMKHIC